MVERLEGEGGAAWTPHPRLAGLVVSMTGYAFDAGDMTSHRGMPSTSLVAVLALGQPLRVGWLDRPDSEQGFWVLASGLSIGAAEITQDGHQEGIQLGLTPAGARAIFGVPAAELHDGLVAFEELIGPGASLALYDDVASAIGWPARFAALERHLLALAAAHDERAARAEVAHAWQALTGPGPRSQVSEVAES